MKSLKFNELIITFLSFPTKKPAYSDYQCAVERKPAIVKVIAAQQPKSVTSPAMLTGWTVVMRREHLKH